MRVGCELYGAALSAPTAPGASRRAAGCFATSISFFGSAINLVGALVVALGAARSAAADSNHAAEETFQRGRAMMARKQYAEACRAFEQSQRLDPELGTLFNLADCESHLGKVASAWNHFRELARTDSNRDRRALAVQLAADLEHRVPKLTIALSASPVGVQVSLDGADVTSLVGEPIPIDLGDHVITASAPGFRVATAAAKVVDEGRVVRVEVRLKPRLAGESESDGGADAPVAHVSRASLGRTAVHPSRTTSIAAFAGSGAVLVGGIVATAIAYSTWRRANSCTGCDRVGLSHRAFTAGDVATGLVIAGLAGAGLGVYLWHRESTSAQLAPSRDGVAIAGWF